MADKQRPSRLTVVTNQVGNQFLLPDELGWACNDEISKYIDTWLEMASKYMTVTDKQLMYPVAKAELMDNIYAIIKKYQAKL